jgi:tetratricopeptide (TPR) repeat protein
MTEVRELDAATYEQIKALCAKGDKLADAREFDDALVQYGEAWDLLPNPKDGWNASTWILAAIADACFLGGYRTSALEALQDAMWCPGAIGNPFLHLRLGQVLFDDGEDLDRAADELLRAYIMGEGEEIFSSEDPRYLAFLRTRAIL